MDVCCTHKSLGIRSSPQYGTNFRISQDKDYGVIILYNRHIIFIVSVVEALCVLACCAWKSISSESLSKLWELIH